MNVASVVALAAHMQMQVLMAGVSLTVTVTVIVVLVVVLMTVQLQPEGRAHGEGTDHQQGDANKELRPGGHGLNVSEVLDADGDQGKNDDAGGMTGSPGQSTAAGGAGSVEREGSHRHEVIRAADDMNSACGESGENGDQQRLWCSVCGFCRSSSTRMVRVTAKSGQFDGTYCE